MTRPYVSDGFRPGRHYRRETFLKGLKRCGYQIGVPVKAHPEPGDLLLLWNRSGHWDHHATRYERAGARVIVVENGFIGADEAGGELFAMALGHHNGAGVWNEGGPDRWEALGIELQPWRRDGREIVVLPQRGIGERGVAMPRTWVGSIVSRLRQMTDRPIRVRMHPGKDRTHPAADLGKAWAAVTWASGAGIKSIVHGVPVFHELPQWVGSGAARHLESCDIENPFLGDRLPMLRRLAWAQWSAMEIESGAAFRHLLG